MWQTIANDQLMSYVMNHTMQIRQWEEVSFRKFHQKQEAMILSRVGAGVAGMMGGDACVALG